MKLFMAFLLLVSTQVFSSDLDKLKEINDKFNSVYYASDAKVWGELDYYATPAEFSSVGAGDCDDYAVAKYFAAKEAGIPYMKFAVGMSGRVGHAVALYCPPNSECLVLDNNFPTLEKLSDVFNLDIEFTIDDDGITKVGNSYRFSRLIIHVLWNDMLERKASGTINEPVWASTGIFTKLRTR